MRTFGIWVLVVLVAALLLAVLRPRWAYRVEEFTETDWQRPAEGLRGEALPAKLGDEGWEIVSARWVSSEDGKRGYECVLRRRLFP